jgi:hypothetical protein
VDVEITELFDLNVSRHDGVEKPASGFSFLVTKSAAPAAPAPEGEMDTEIEKAAPEATPETSEAPEGAVTPTAPEAPAAVEKAAFDALAERVEKMESDLAEANGRVRAAEDREVAAKAELEALKATPLPGGPVLAASDQDHVFKAKREAVQKAAYWRKMTEIATTQEMRMEYESRAKAAEAEAR